MPQSQVLGLLHQYWFIKSYVSIPPSNLASNGIPLWLGHQSSGMTFRNDWRGCSSDFSWHCIWFWAWVLRNCRGYVHTQVTRWPPHPIKGLHIQS
jgi:hypothetical protein